jgi:hypothetical protein
LKALTAKALMSILEMSPIEALDVLTTGNHKEQSWYPQLTSKYQQLKREVITTIESFRDDYFFKEIVETRGPGELHYLEGVLARVQKEMVSEPYPTGQGSVWAVCNNCSFKDPCFELREGNNPHTTLKELYHERTI